MNFETSLLLLTWIALLLLGLALAGVIRQIHDLRSALAAGGGSLRPIDTVVARLAAATDDWEKPTFLLFADDDCEACSRVVPAFEELARDQADALFVALYMGKTARNGGAIKVLDGQAGLFRDLGVPMVPYAIRVAAGGEHVAAEPVGSPRSLRKFVNPKEGAYT